MPNTELKKRLHVAVGVIVDRQQRILIALRPDDVHQGGLWEFPGGKVESGECVERALSRELHEELGLNLLSCRPLMAIEHDYPDKRVLLDVWWVDQFGGVPEGREGQPVKWVAAGELGSYHFPAANRAIVEEVLSQLSDVSY